MGRQLMEAINWHGAKKCFSRVLTRAASLTSVIDNQSTPPISFGITKRGCGSRAVRATKIKSRLDYEEGREIQWKLRGQVLED